MWFTWMHHQSLSHSHCQRYSRTVSMWPVLISNLACVWNTIFSSSDVLRRTSLNGFPPLKLQLSTGRSLFYIITNLLSFSWWVNQTTKFGPGQPATTSGLGWGVVWKRLFLLHHQRPNHEQRSSSGKWEWNEKSAATIPLMFPLAIQCAVSCDTLCVTMWYNMQGFSSVSLIVLRILCCYNLCTLQF